jgi:hypothetical protein
LDSITERTYTKNNQNAYSNNITGRLFTQHPTENMTRHIKPMFFMPTGSLGLFAVRTAYLAAMKGAASFKNATCKGSKQSKLLCVTHAVPVVSL